MDFPALVLHGLSAISVFADTVTVRLILAIFFLIVVLAVLLGVALAARWGNQFAVPGWTIFAAGLFLVAVMQMLTVAVGLSLLILFNRSNLSFLPLRDFRFFIGTPQTLYARAA
jgi:hypothetical protein